jgi:hypothetical protein
MYHIGICIKRAVFVALTFAVLLGLFVSPSRAQEKSTEDLYDLILEVKRDRETLSAVLLGLEKDGAYYLPVRSLGQILGFEAEVDLSTRSVSGFYIDTANTYSVEIDQGVYKLQGRSFPLPEGAAFTIDQGFGIGDVYVTVDLLNIIWPLDIELNSLLAELNIKTEQKLPFELIKDRQSRRQGTLNG